MAMLDSTTDEAAPGEWRQRSPGHPADPSLFDFTGPASGPENP